MKETSVNPSSIVDEIRSIDGFMDIHQRKADELMALVQKEIINNLPQISVQRFREQYLPPILSEDRDETEAGMKILASHVGGVQRQFYVFDDRTNEIIFRFHAVSVPFRSGAYDYKGLSTAGSILNFKQSQNAQIPGQIAAFGQALANDMRKAMNFDNAKVIFHHGWLEMTDFCNLMTDAEEKFYAPYRKQKAESNTYAYWCHPLSMEDYIAKHGRVEGEYKRPIPDKLATLAEVLKVQQDIANQSHFPMRIPQQAIEIAEKHEQARQAYLAEHGQSTSTTTPSNAIVNKAQESTDDWD